MIERKGIFLLFLLWCWDVSWAAGKQRIDLLDGSEITGEVLSLEAGVYRIRTESLGVIEVRQSQIQAIRSSAGVAAANTLDQRQLQSIQNAIAADPRMMQRIMLLQKDPAFQAALHDADVQAALQSGDFQALMNHPAIRQLTTHPTVRQLSTEFP